MHDSLPQTMVGSVHLQYRRCGRPTCHCRHGDRHPAFYLFWRRKGRLRKRYLKASEVERVRAACERRRLEAQLLRDVQRDAREKWHALVAYIREVKHHD